MTTSPANPLATALAAIRAEGYLDGPVPRLLKAVEAVQRLATDWEGRAAETYQAAIRAADRGALPERVEALEAQAKTLGDTAAKLRATIERALTGEDGSDRD